MLHAHLSEFVRSFLALRSQSGNTSVRRISDQRSSVCSDNIRSAVVPELVVCASHVEVGGQVTAIGVGGLNGLLCKFSRFFFGEKLFVSKLGGALQRCHCSVGPDSLKVRLPVRRPGRSVCGLGRQRRLSQK